MCVSITVRERERKRDEKTGICCLMCILFFFFFSILHSHSLLFRFVDSKSPCVRTRKRVAISPCKRAPQQPVVSCEHRQALCRFDRWIVQAIVVAQTPVWIFVSQCLSSTRKVLKDLLKRIPGAILLFLNLSDRENEPRCGLRDENKQRKQEQIFLINMVEESLQEPRLKSLSLATPRLMGASASAPLVAAAAAAQHK